MSRPSIQSRLEALRDRGLWNGCCTTTEVTLHQLSPYIGKLKSGIVHSLIDTFSRKGDLVCDPFCGSGVVPLQAVIQGRRAFANDLSRYAWLLTTGKLNAPMNLGIALNRLEALDGYVQEKAPAVDARSIPRWVRRFFNTRTLKEVITAFRYCQRHDEYFLAACMCGILHHQRPGFLSFPASHTVPYLRTGLFPPVDFPEMYEYRDLKSRLLAKITRAYARTPQPIPWNATRFDVRLGNANQLPLKDGSVDMVLTSPPYYKALDYARDNRLRLWFLGVRDWSVLDKKLTKDGKKYEDQMRRSLQEMFRILKPGGHCILIVGEVQQQGKTKDTAGILAKMATDVSRRGFGLKCSIEDEIPDSRRSRRHTRTTRIEKVLVLEKRRTLVAGGEC